MIYFKILVSSDLFPIEYDISGIYLIVHPLYGEFLQTHGAHKNFSNLQLFQTNCINYTDKESKIK